jgi:predicted NAD/FAD-binding protein
MAVIGSGISGLAATYLLNPTHDVTLYEKNDSTGGHARTRLIRYGDRDIAVDTGFIVFNHVNYPHLSSLFAHLGVPVQKSVMSFGVMAPADNLEWGAENLNALFGQRRNLVRPAFYRFLKDVLTFNALAVQATRDTDMTLDDLIKKLKLGDWFRRYYILPMGGAIWSCSLQSMLSFPARFFVDFFDAHGLLTVTAQPQWYTVTGGSAVYIERLIDSFRMKIKISCGVANVLRRHGKVQITDSHGNVTQYDDVIFACHANETLALLADATEDERKILGSFRYQKNTAVLHKYSGVMPQRRACWGSWVYHADATANADPIGVTYWMNHLQGIDKNYPLFVTLNPRTPIPEGDIFERHIFDHPVYDPAAVAAQARLPSLQGQQNTWFCGAYHRNGFHEDGLVSAINIAALMGVTPPWE